jgi:hypothetical protein
MRKTPALSEQGRGNQTITRGTKGFNQTKGAVSKGFNQTKAVSKGFNQTKGAVAKGFNQTKIRKSLLKEENNHTLQATR